MIVDLPITEAALKKAWADFITQLKEAKNPAWQSFEIATLQIKDDNSFEAIVTNNITQKFLELERNKANAFLQQALGNRQLQLIVVLVEGPKEEADIDMPLSSRDQYQKIVEQFPLVKELRDRLRLDLDY